MIEGFGTPFGDVEAWKTTPTAVVEHLAERPGTIAGRLTEDFKGYLQGDGYSQLSDTFDVNGGSYGRSCQQERATKGVSCLAEPKPVSGSMERRRLTPMKSAQGRLCRLILRLPRTWPGDSHQCECEAPPDGIGDRPLDRPALSEASQSEQELIG